MAEIQFDFNNNGAVTLDDISFGEPDIVDAVIPEVEKPVTKETTTSTETLAVEKSADGEEAVVPLAKADLEEIEFSKEGEDSADANTGAEKKDVSDTEVKEIPQDYKLKAVVGLLQAKLERNDIETEVDLTSLTEEQLVDFEKALDDKIIDNKYNQYKSIDPNIKLLSDYIENGGNPKTIAKLFEERDALTKIDITSEAGQIKMVKAYYEDVLGWPKEKVNSKIDRLSASESLAAEAEDVSQQYDEYCENQITKEAEAQERRQAVEVQREIKKRDIFESALKVSKIPTKTQDDLKRVAFGEGVLPNGQTIKILDYQILKMQSDPDSFLKLAYFLANPEEYDKTILQYNKNAEVTNNLKKGFNFEPKPKAANISQVEKKPDNKKLTFKF